MILVAVGSNLSSPALGGPAEVCERALRVLDSGGVRVRAVSRFFETAPVPVSDQPWFVNAVARVETDLPPAALLARLHEVEQAFGRVRQRLNEARVLDLDLIDYDGLRQDGPPILPHPRMGGRAFVLHPLRDLAPDWCHPVEGTPLDLLLSRLPADQEIRPMAGARSRMSGLD